MYEWQDKFLKESSDSILQCLEEERIVSIEATEGGFKLIELCDRYYGITLSNEQFQRLIAEMQELLKTAN